MLVYLSSNVAVQKYVQTDGEALLMAVKMYALLLEQGNELQAKEYLEECNTKQQGVSMTMANPESRQFVLNLYKLEGHMAFTMAFGTKWIREHILCTYGGVSKN